MFRFQFAAAKKGKKWGGELKFFEPISPKGHRISTFTIEPQFETREKAVESVNKFIADFRKSMAEKLGPSTLVDMETGKVI